MNTGQRHEALVHTPYRSTMTNATRPATEQNSNNNHSRWQKNSNAIIKQLHSSLAVSTTNNRMRSHNHERDITRTRVQEHHISFNTATLCLQRTAHDWQMQKQQNTHTHTRTVLYLQWLTICNAYWQQAKMAFPRACASACSTSVICSVWPFTDFSSETELNWTGSSKVCWTVFLFHISEWYFHAYKRKTISVNIWCVTQSTSAHFWRYHYWTDITKQIYNIQKMFSAQPIQSGPAKHCKSRAKKSTYYKIKTEGWLTGN